MKEGKKKYFKKVKKVRKKKKKREREDREILPHSGVSVTHRRW